MAIDDGDTWNWISEDAYQPDSGEDPPQHTALDHYVREQHYHLGRMRDPVSRAYPIEVDGTLPAKYSSIHWSAFAYTTMMAWSRDKQATIYWVGEVDNTDVHLLPFVINMNRGDVQSNEVYEFTLNTASEKSYNKTTIVFPNDWGKDGDYVIMAGVAVKSPLPTSTYDSVNPSGGPSFATLASTPSYTGQHLVMWDGRNTSRRYDILRYADTGFEATSDDRNFAYTPDQDQRIFSNTKWGPLSGARTYNLSVSTKPAQGDYDPYRRELIRPSVPPRYDRGAGQHIRRSEQLYQRPRTFSGKSQNFELKPDAEWGRSPQWSWVDSGESQTYTKYTYLRNAAGQPVIQTPMVVALIDTSATLQSGDLADSLESSYRQADTIGFNVTSTVLLPDGSGLDETSSTLSLPALAPSPDAKSTFLQQIYLHLEGARNESTDGDTNWMAKEGQLYISGFQRGSADYDALEVIKPSIVPVALPSETGMYRLKTTIDLTNTSDKRLYIIDSCISDYILPAE